MRYLLLMTLAGSALFIGYMYWERVFEGSLTQNMRYKALIIVLLTYALPWVWLKEIYSRIWGAFWFDGVIAGLKGGIKLAEIKAGQESYKTADYQLLTIFMGVWLFGVIFLVLIKSLKFFKRRRSLQRLAIECCDENLKPTVELLQREMHYWRKPEVVCIRANSGTLTLGSIRPVIFLQREYAEGELYWILKHEMVHIIRRDMLIKLIQEFVRCFHWFNPFVHILMHKINFICEASCDERALSGAAKEEQEAYALMLDKNSKMQRQQIQIGNRLESNDEDVEKRIALIRSTGKGKVRRKRTAIVVFCLLVFIDSLTALAYPKVRHVEVAAIETAEEAIGGGNFWLKDYEEEGYDIVADTILYDKQFTDKAGNIYPADPNAIKEPCAEHDIVPGIYQEHIKHDDNSCTVEIYEGTRCVNCGAVWVDTLSMTTDHDSCIH